jgi:hypothetical protein
MSQQTDSIKRASTKLTSAERKEIIKFLEDYEKGTINEQRNLSDSLEKSLGPLATSRCAICGK